LNEDHRLGQKNDGGKLGTVGKVYGVVPKRLDPYTKFAGDRVDPKAVRLNTLFEERLRTLHKWKQDFRQTDLKTCGN
jgi:hypothetical protein